MFRPDSLFSRFMNTLADILLTGILWLVCCIPLITIGAASTAAYYTMAKCVRHKTGYIHKEYFHSFKANFKQATLLHLPILIAEVILAMDLWYLWTYDTKLNSMLFIIICGITFLLLCVVAMLWPILSRFTKKNTELIRTTAFVAFHYLPITVGILLMFAVACVGIWLMPWAILVIPGVYLWGYSYPMEIILKRLMPKPEEGSEEADKWYYQ